VFGLYKAFLRIIFYDDRVKRAELKMIVLKVTKLK